MKFTKFFLILIFLSTIVLAKGKKVTLQLSWFDQFQFAGYYMAKKKGFYKEAGLDVQINPFQFGLDIPTAVSDEKFDFAVGRETLMLQKAKGKDIVSLFALFQASPLILIATKESGIDSIKDFANKKIMTTIDDASEVSIKSMITSQKLDITELNFIKHSHNIDDLINKKTDIISAYTSKAPYHLLQKKIPYNIFAPKDYGFDMYSDLLYTSKSKIDNDLQTVIKFKNASLKGWEYAYENIEETVNLILEKYNTQNLTKQELLFEAKELKKLSYYQTDTLGDINLPKLQRIYDLYNVMGLVEKKIAIEEFVFIDNSLMAYLKNVWKNISKYKELPYIYFFISLFLVLIMAVIYKQIMLTKVQKELLKVNLKLKEHSEKDHLTKLYNRRYFESIAKEQLALSKREKSQISLLMLDIDDFKKVNDTYGHQAGDAVLCLLATVLTKHKRQSDVVARYGGEEFIILLPHTSLDGAKVYAQNLKNEVQNQTIQLDEVKLNITISIGLAMLNEDDNIDSVIDRADEGLYISKRNGKNQVSVVI